MLTLLNSQALGQTGNAGEQTLALLDSGNQNISLVNAVPFTTAANPYTQFTLSFNGGTTPALTYTGVAATDAASIQSALNTLLGANTVTVTANAADTTFSVLFGGNFGGTSQVIQANVVSGDPGSTDVDLAGPVPNATAFTLTFNGQTTPTITYTGNSAIDIANIATALNALVGAGSTVLVTSSSTGIFDINFLGLLASTSLPVTATVTSAASDGTATVVAGGGTLVANGASLELQGNLTVGNETLVVQGTGSTNTPTVPEQWFPVRANSDQERPNRQQPGHHRPHQRRRGRSDRCQRDLHWHGRRRRLENDQCRPDLAADLRRHSQRPGHHQQRQHRHLHLDLQRPDHAGAAVQRHGGPDPGGPERALLGRRRGGLGHREPSPATFTRSPSAAL